jgi:hypothetical protein
VRRDQRRLRLHREVNLPVEFAQLRHRLRIRDALRPEQAEVVLEVQRNAAKPNKIDFGANPADESNSTYDSSETFA